MNASGPITRRGFIGGAAPRRTRRQGLRAGLCRARRKPPTDLRQSFPAGRLHFPPTTARIRSFASSGGM